MPDEDYLYERAEAERDYAIDHGLIDQSTPVVYSQGHVHILPEETPNA